MRSGTTLMEQVLASQPDAVSLEEKEALVSGTNTFLGGAEGMQRLAEADEDALASHRADYWERVRRFGVDPDDKVFVDKMPLNGMKLPLIHRLFPWRPGSSSRSATPATSSSAASSIASR